MYHLATELYYYATSKEEYSVLLLGLDNAGKTTLLEKIKSLYLPNGPLPPKAGSTIPTVGQNVSLIPLSSPSIYLKLWDIGGQSTLRSLWKSYYSSAHAIVFVIDSTDVPRIESEVVDVLKEVVEHEETEGVPVLVLANKQDRDESLEIAQLKEVVNPVIVSLGARDSRVLPVSALEGTGVKEAVDWLKTRVMWNKESRPPTMR
ncbi:P-loop containing nucleoside triphosphate hydrolase protein [Morchella conica CCBAS932]|uniref:P-loop containing nucleoside triphosphate hydrolase protein n=2 Tax=Morchella sect. Distantes TaxID=1051054 RepID=A0A3N4KZM4_9PEZI|nr:P-loop containing nucleoside triphosphate hydrolase protein [Morchella conica CCBAS932]